MTRFETGDVVRVAFPHVETNEHRSRPALVLTRRPLGLDGMLIWVAMITNAGRKHWPGDTMIEDLGAAGLPVPSKVRTAKIATIEAAAASRIGRLGENQIDDIRRQIIGYLGDPRP